jgi:hypothetical protein
METEINISAPWTALPPLIEFLRKSRDSFPKLSDSFNITIVLHSATIIEGVLSQLLKNEVWTDYSSSFKNRLETEYIDRIEKSSWNEIQHLYLIMIGEKLSDEVDNNLWKAITTLFKLRNSLTHSNLIEVTYFLENNKKVDKIEISSKYKSVYNYLANEKGIIEKLGITNNNSHLKLITNKSADFFWENTIDFLKIVLGKKQTTSTLTETLFNRALKKANLI